MDQNNKAILSAVAIVLVVVLVRVFSGGEPENVQTLQSQTVPDSLESVIEPIKILDAMENASFDEVSNQQKEQAQQRFNQATEYLLKQEWRSAEGILVDLVEHYPSMVEPFINLAYVYAKTERLSQARETLVKGIGANRSYDILFANLQSIHGALAAQAYRAALVSEDQPTARLTVTDLRLDMSLISSLDLSRVDLDLQQALAAELKNLQSQRAQTELSEEDLQSRIAGLEVELLEASNRVAQQDTTMRSQLALLQSQIDQQSLALAAQAEQKAAEIVALEYEEPLPQQQAAIASEEIPLVVAADPEVIDEIVEVEVVDIVDVVDQITDSEKSVGAELVKEWAARWSAQDVQGYIKRYVNNYRPPNNAISPSEWRDQREIRLTNKQFINVNVADFRFEESDTQFSVIFSQRYQSNTMDDTITKKLVFTKNGDSWNDAKIIDEVIVRS